MPLEIKILDYGDIELESSFLVLGRGCGRTRRVPTLGFLILGGPWPIVVDTGYRSNQIMETLGMRGLQFHENMIENQLKRHGVRNYSIFLDCETDRLFAYAEIESEELWRQIAQTEVCQRWWAHMKDLMLTNDDNSPVAITLDEVFHLD